MLRAPLRPISRAFHAMPPLRRKLSEPERVETVARFAARGWTDKFPERDAVEKTYEFKDFSQAWGDFLPLS